MVAMRSHLPAASKPKKAYAVCVNGFDATIKRVKPLSNGYELIPDSIDPT